MEPLIAILVVAGLLWATLFVLRGSLITGCLAFLLVNACFGFYFYNFNVGTANMTLDRPVLILLGLAYVVQRSLGRTDPKPFGLRDAVPMAFVGWLAVRTFTSDWTNPSCPAPTPLWLFLSGYASPLALYWIVRQSPLNEGAIKKIQWFFIGLGIYLSITAALEISGQWWLVFPQHIADPTLAQHFGRARGPMLNSMSLGFFLTICLLCAWNMRARLGARGQIVMLGLCLLNLAALYFTYTRVVWIGAIVTVVMLAWMVLPRRVAVVGTGAVLLAMGLLVVTKADELWALDTGRNAGQTRDSSEMRLSFNYVAWQMYKDSPLLGWGFGQFIVNSPLYLSDRSTEFTLEHIRGAPVHNEFMSILVETGPLGLLLLLSMLGVWAFDGWRMWRNRYAPEWCRSQGLLMFILVPVYMCHAVFHPLGHTYMAQFAIYMFAGVSAGLQASVKTERPQRHRLLPSRTEPASRLSATP